MRMRPQPAWMRKLKPGDVIVSASGLERVVRRVSLWRGARGAYPRERLHMVEVTIAHCSWTYSGTTMMDQSCLVQGGYRKKRGVRYSMRTAMDRRIKAYTDWWANWRENRAAGVPEPELTCCDVRGIR